ncbi:hypothetical protein PHYPSEUDO_011859 [Phytophthora pseudosyringae]|uniref:Uncharacterized protein n=1 Tax=Phytophthora pseudosyringae TaxID=221518 RepID=A0A8T1VB52_9STRA|nr:hypothetical protein PHYPSEUDO_011859 [Phytophthora pseudosyringae]
MLQVGLTTLNYHNITLDNPVTWTCNTLKACDNWTHAQSIYWWNLPDGCFVKFYEIGNCIGGGKYQFVSDHGQTSGAFKFQPSKAIRSVMVGKHSNYARRSDYTPAVCHGESTITVHASK